jgi:aspartate 1-decarboxylase
MQISLLKSKLHRATVTGASLHYEGSLTISSDLAELVGLFEYEKILVGNLNNGERFETYAIYGPARRGMIELNGCVPRENWRPRDHHELCTLHARGSGAAQAAHSRLERKK